MNSAPAPRNESGVPLGGIGAGKIEFCRDGRFTNVTINNNLDSPITDGWARMPLFPRIQEGADFSVLENGLRRQSINAPEGLPGAWMAVHTPRDGGRLLKTVGRLAFRPISAADIDYDGRFPWARVGYRGFAAIDLSVDAYSSLELIDADEACFNSSLPLALFAFRATGRGPAATRVTLAFSWQNLNGIGGYPMTLINEGDPTPPAFRDEAFGPGLWFDHDPSTTVDRRVVGNYSLRVWSSAAGAKISHSAGWNPAGEGHDVWDSLSRDGCLDNAVHHSTAGALAAEIRLAPGETQTVVFALAWHMPHLLAAETRWDHLVRPSSAPPPPVDPNRRDYGHAYARWFADSWAVAEHGLRHWQTIRDRIASWQDALAGSSLPPLAAAGLSNDLCALITNSWYTRDGHYAINEAPTDMNGCFGTIDQRSVGNAAVACAFPMLNKAELDLFARDQIRAEGDPRRHGIHWNARGGHFDLPLDRAGAILHDIGWDHLEGGRTGDSVWASAHWPEQTSHFVLQCYQQALWTGDRAWLDELYPRFKAALEFQARLDQDGDGVPDLWGHGSCTYDTELYPYYSASAYTAGLYLAALRVGHIVAEAHGDKTFADITAQRFATVQRVMEEELWDEPHGYYHCWRDRSHTTWTGARSHGPRSTNCHISQLAGAWWAEMLGLGDIVDPLRRRRALDFIGRHNVALVAGCPADEYCLDGRCMQSMTALVMGNYAAQAIAAGLPDHGWAAAEKIYKARYEHDGCPWDATLQWSGEANLRPQWGRWYMSHPASWYVLLALGGLRLDRLRGTLGLAPSWPSGWSDRLRALPVFQPGLRGEVEASRSAEGWEVHFTVKRLLSPLTLKEVTAWLPGRVLGKDFDPARARVEVEGLDPAAVAVLPSGRVSIAKPVRLEKEGDGFRIAFLYG
jgi:uncharacterized protein (DUF608 family)